jgi:mannose-6-phosphate isomerase-like protein (cupin superfamily)
MAFTEISKKGIAKFSLEAGIDPERMSVHISEAEPGTRLHPPHTHAGLEGFYVLEGRGTVESEGGRQPVGPNEVVIVDASKPHGLINTGTTRMRYIVIIAKA